MSHSAKVQQVRTAKGFIAALDQSGGSTPKALRLYGVDEREYAGDGEMFDQIHAMRTRIVKSPAFTGEKVIGAILFENTMDREIDGQPSAQYLWQARGVVPFLKVDKGLEEASDDVRLMKPMPNLDDLCARASVQGIFGTKMRSVIDAASAIGINHNVDQQFEIARQILGHGLVPIIEPEITISITDKAAAEDLLRTAIAHQLDQLGEGQDVMLKLSLPDVINQYAPLINHPRVMRVVALSGGYSRMDANARLSQNSSMIASFSRALTEGLSAHQSDANFDAMLGNTINSIYQASVSG